MPGVTIKASRGKTGARPALASTLAATLAGLSVAACATSPQHAGPGAKVSRGALQSRPDANRYKVGKPYQVRGVWYTPAEQPDYDEVGVGSWYGEQFHNRYTASGEVFDMDILSAAHKTLPLPSLVEVTNLDNGRKAILRVNDRGPFVDGRIIDLSKAAADKLGYGRQGLARVRVRYVGPAPLIGSQPRLYQASAPARAAAARPIIPPMPPAPTWTPSLNGPLPPAIAISSAPIAEPNAPAPALTPAPEASKPAPQAVIAAAPPTGAYGVQAGAFSTLDRAQKVAQVLASAGPARIVTVQRDGGVLYKVVVTGGPDETAAYAVRDRVADLGFADARVVAAQ